MVIGPDMSGHQLEPLWSGDSAPVQQVQQRQTVLTAGDGDKQAVAIIEQAIVPLCLVQCPEQIVCHAVGTAHVAIVPRAQVPGNRPEGHSLAWRARGAEPPSLDSRRAKSIIQVT